MRTVTSVSTAVFQLINRFCQLTKFFLIKRRVLVFKKSFDKVEKWAFHLCNLTYFRSLSIKTQGRLALADSFIEELYTVTMLLFMAFFLLFAGRYVLLSAAHFFTQGTPSLQIVHLILEAAACLAMIQNAVRKAFLFLKLLFLVVLVWCTQAQEIEKRAVTEMQSASVAQFIPFGFHGTQQHDSSGNTTLTITSGLNMITSYRFTVTLSTIWVNGFMRGHTRLLADLVLFNRHFASKLIFWFYFPLIIVSIYILCVVYFLPVPFLFRLYLFGLYLSAVVLFSLLFSLPMPVRALYSSGDRLYKAQMSCRASMGKQENVNATVLLRTKLKLMSYYEVMKTNKKVTFTFGSHAKVENRWLLEVSKKIKFFYNLTLFLADFYLYFIYFLLV